jgi:ectoine hydroxylase-related dioxygenase (phytanoyl-CoA dioxygenase family)
MIKNYLSKGYLKARLFNNDEFDIIQEFFLNHIARLLRKYKVNKKSSKKKIIETYHKLNINEKEHSKIFQAKNRHFKMPKSLKDIILNPRLKKILSQILFAELKKKKIKLWDEKYGDIAFRIVRPFSKDGYPFTKKEWGPAGNAVSIWVPIIGMNKNNTIKFVSGSNQKTYEKFLPKNTKFIKNEYRLRKRIKKKKISSLKYQKGDGLIFSSKLLHSEDNNFSKITRVNIEFRIK